MPRLKIGHVAKEIGVSPQTIRNLQKRAGIYLERDWDRNRIFTPEDIQKISALLFPQRNRSDGA